MSTSSLPLQPRLSTSSPFCNQNFHFCAYFLPRHVLGSQLRRIWHPALTLTTLYPHRIYKFFFSYHQVSRICPNSSRQGIICNFQLSHFLNKYAHLSCITSAPRQWHPNTNSDTICKSCHFIHILILQNPQHFARLPTRHDSQFLFGLFPAATNSLTFRTQTPYTTEFPNMPYLTLHTNCIFIHNFMPHALISSITSILPTNISHFPFEFFFCCCAKCIRLPSSKLSNTWFSKHNQPDTVHNLYFHAQFHSTRADAFTCNVSADGYFALPIRAIFAPAVAHALAGHVQTSQPPAPLNSNRFHSNAVMQKPRNTYEQNCEFFCHARSSHFFEIYCPTHFSMFPHYFFLNSPLAYSQHKWHWATLRLHTNYTTVHKTVYVLKPKHNKQIAIILLQYWCKTAREISHHSPSRLASAL